MAGSRVKPNSPDVKERPLMEEHNKDIIPSSRGRDPELLTDVDHPVSTRATCGTYMLLMIVGMSANLGSNALFVQMPALTPILPEGHDLTYLLLGMWELGNLSAIVYLLARKCSQNKTSEPPAIHVCLWLNVTVFALLGFFWDKRISIYGQEHSLPLILCMVVSGQMSGLASVTYIPMVSRMKPGYITAVLLGDCFAGLLPHALGVAEGLSTPPDCKPDLGYSSNMSWAMYDRQSRMHISTTKAPAVPPKLRFPEYCYFFAICGSLFLSSICFLILRLCPSMRYEYVRRPVDSMEDEMSGHGIEEIPRVQILDDGKIQPKTPVPVPVKSKVKFTNPAASNRSGVSKRWRPGEAKPPSFILLMFITWWASLAICGPLSSVRAHSCVPSGNTAFFIGTLLTNAGAALTCIVVLKLSPHIKVTLVVAFTCLATILLTYFSALIVFSHRSESSEKSPIYGSFGELLVTVGWSAIIGLFVFARTAIAVICRHHEVKWMIWYACMAQLGSAMGSLGLISNISICQVYKSYEEIICVDI